MDEGQSVCFGFGFLEMDFIYASAVCHPIICYIVVSPNVEKLFHSGRIYILFLLLLERSSSVSAPFEK